MKKKYSRRFYGRRSVRLKHSIFRRGAKPMSGRTSIPRRFRGRRIS